MNSYISFPGLGIEPFHIDKVAFSVFGRDVAWYGLILTFGIVVAIVLAYIFSKAEKISSDDLIDLALYVVIVGIICARIYYVVFSWNEFDYLVTDAVSDGTFWGSISAFFSNFWRTFVNCIAIWEGGIAIYGAVIGGMIVGIIFAKIKKINFLKVYDLIIPCVMAGQVIGRWGNFVNMEAHGGETTLPWRMGLLYGNPSEGLLLLEEYVHPTFFYESLWNLIGLIPLLIFYKKKKFNGQHFAYYLIWYGFGRMLIEGLRTDSLMLGSFRISQLVGLCSVIIGIVLFVVLSRIKSLKISEE